MVTSTSEKLTNLLPEPDADPVPSTSKLSSHFDISTQGLRERPMSQFPHVKSEYFVDIWKVQSGHFGCPLLCPLHTRFLPHINPDLRTRAAILAIISALPLKSPNFASPGLEALKAAWGMPKCAGFSRAHLFPTRN